MQALNTAGCACTHRVKDDGDVTGEAADHVPVRLLHASGIAVSGRIGRAENPEESGNHHDGEDETKDPRQHGAGEAGKGDGGCAGGAVLGRRNYSVSLGGVPCLGVHATHFAKLLAAVGVRHRDIPQRRGERSAEDEEEEAQAESE